MTKKDKDAAKEGFQIPIEDGDVASGEPETPGARDASSADPAASVGASSSSPSGSGAVDDEDNAETAESPDDLIAEAEAIVEEASEGAEGAAPAEGEPPAADDLAAARAEAAEWQDRYMRLHAEWDTYRRRTGEQRAEEKARATEKLMEALLPVLDDFERTVSYAEENGEGGLLDGVRAVQTKLVDALVKGGLEVIDPAGEAYDALEAQAVATVPDEEAYDETVSEVYQKGYRMGKKVLRPAMVTVTTGGPKRPKEDES